MSEAETPARSIGVVVVEAYVDAIRFAADEVHRAARYQREVETRGSVRAASAVLLELEQTFRALAEIAADAA